MVNIKVTKTPIKDLLIIEPKVFGDERGYFVETYNQRELAEVGLDVKFVQDNQSQSKKGVLRGLHYQKQNPQGKLVRVITGNVFDVAVDLRKDSDTYGKWFGIELSAENFKQLYIPEHFAHGFLVLSDVAEFSYKVTNYYHPSDEGGIVWNDPDINVEWPGINPATNYTMKDGSPLILSDKDQLWPSLKEI